MKLVLLPSERDTAAACEVTLLRWVPPEELEIEAPLSHPPGARLSMTLTDGDQAHEVRMKVHGCRKVAAPSSAEGGEAQTVRFRIAGRTIDLRKTARSALDAAMASRAVRV
jgi:hypothetical protein